MVKGVTHLPGFTGIAMAVFAGLYLPIVILVVYSFNAGQNLANWEGFGLHWFAKAWANEVVMDATWRSLWLAAVAAVIATACATAAALGTTRRGRFKGQTFIYVMINQPLMVPEIVSAVALLIFFAWFKVNLGYQGMGYLVLAHAAFCIPFAYLPIRARLESMDLTLETAAADLYATPLATFRRVTFPLLLPGILAGFMLAFVTSLDDVVITVFVKSAGQDTLPTYMLGQIRRQVSTEVYAISTMLLGLTVVMLTAFFLLTRKKD